MAEGRDPAAGERLRKAFEGSPGWPKSAAALERLSRERGTPVTATTIRSWFEGTPPQILNLLKVAPILRRAPLELYAAWFDEPLSSNGLTRIADEINELRDVILDAATRRAVDAERQDWDAEQDPDRRAGDERRGGPDKSPA